MLLMHYIYYIIFFDGDNHSARQFTHFIVIFFIFDFNYANFRGTYRIPGDSDVIQINCYVFKTNCLIQGKKDPVGRNALKKRRVSEKKVQFHFLLLQK